MTISTPQRAVEPKNSCIRHIWTLRQNVSALITTTGQNSDASPTDKATFLAVLQNAMSAEIICILYYTNLSVSAIGLRRPQLGREFQAQANDERKHMESMARRIRALGGIPDYHPPDLGNWGTSTANITQSFISIFRQNLEVEQLMVALYHDLLKYFAGRDLETTILLNIIMQDEENHIADLKDLLKE